MNNSPFSIYVRSRPQRIAFLVNPDVNSTEIIDAIVEYNQGKWGGRFNPIIFTDGTNIDEKQWAFLRDYDPDVIKLTTSADDGLLEKIEYFLSPYLVEPWQPIKDAPLRVDIHTEGLSIFPSSKDISRIAGYLADNPKLAAFYIGKNADDNIKRFIVHNFGRYTHYASSDKALNNIPRKVFEIDSIENFDMALTELARSTAIDPFVFPIQFCCSDYSNSRIKYTPEEDFTVIIGDSPLNTIYNWNRGFFIGNNIFTQIKQLWIPKELAKNTIITNSMKEFLQKRVWTINGGAQQINFVSFDMPKNDLMEIAKTLTPQCFIGRYHVFSEIRVPEFDQHYWNNNFIGNSDLHRATGNEAQFVINEPKIIEGPKHGEHWMADLYIQHVSPAYQNYSSNLGFWWKLPKRNRLALSMFNSISRICNNGFPSVLVNRQKPNIKINILDDISVFRVLILLENTPALTIDARKKFTTRPFDDLRRSDKGRYLSGILDLFSGLTNASNYLGEKYWREMFGRLSGQDSSRDETVLHEIDNKLKKNPGGIDPVYLLHIARQYGIRGKELTYHDFLEKAVSALKGFLYVNHSNLLNFQFELIPSIEQYLSNNKLPKELYIEFNKHGIVLSGKSELSIAKQNQQWFITDVDNNTIFVIFKEDGIFKVYTYEYNEADLKGNMSNLTKSNVLFTGIRPKCPFCGSASWYHIDEAKQNLRCKGCNFEYSMPAYQEWYYKLNTLIQAGCFGHGLIPVILVLGELLLYPSVSFFYAPCLELFEKYGSDSYGDIDIVCIQDGKFVIGEIKQSIGLFKPNDFIKMGDIAERIHPNMLLFSSMDRKPNRVVSEGIENLAKRLSKYEIDVKWHQLQDSIYDPSRVMFHKE